MYKKIVSIIISVGLITSVCGYATGRFKDLVANDMEEVVERLADKGIVVGISEDLFGPNESVTRAEFCALIVRAMHYDITSYDDRFLDVKSDEWFATYILTLAKKGIVSGSDGYFDPNRSVTIEEAAKILVCTYENTCGELTYLSSTVATGSRQYFDISLWAREYMVKATMLGLVPRPAVTNYRGLFGGDDDTYPQKELSRIEAAEVIFNIGNVIDRMNYLNREE